MKFFCAIALMTILGIPVLFSESPASSVISSSPDGKFIVRRLQAATSDRGEVKKRLEICTASGKVLYAWESSLGSTTVLWRSDSLYLAVNDMPGEGGDLLRIFFIDSGKSEVTPTRQPVGHKLLNETEERRGGFFTAIEAVHLRASEWRGLRLWCGLNGTVHPKRQPSIHAPFHTFLVYAMNGTNAPILQEEWTLTSPKEKPYRDPIRWE